ncbi:VWA domain-containing protein [Aurantimonas sp. C2-6-R+9]|uniref:vWA domain-containing protein n=1 Tax=unclassified Aurantimonas TaxID=2638230 RepID=UPI002E197E5D|nr:MULTISPECIES: VWA domain-containing protein [unclassified Aurantimonas]MEC5290025.1 VWA domain-containing protein [Aurantimonas sp. C2-3-R2]MEC5381247.1 VWA domain-containing protein [Aurantimonas sp. C2-6-R+9]MEC5411090.1 VWA domain-containing protein [Aurantimonas sp. C2-4-R8]
MFLTFFLKLKAAGVPVTLREHLAFLDAVTADLVTYDVEGFYYLARASLVKDERFIDRFDRVFSEIFKGIEAVSGETGGVDMRELPEEWLRRLAEKHLTDEEKKLVESLGGFDKLMETLKQRLEEQQGRHQGGSKWIGTGGTSPFGAYGYNPEGIRIGQKESRHRKAVKVWDRREFRNLDDSVELGTRNIKVALKRLRRWVRDGAEEEFDLPATIRSTAEHGYLDVKTRPERRNAVKVLLFLDIGGSMDDHVRAVEELFSAARSELKHLEFFYFHNCPYERLWKDNRRRHAETISTMDVLHTFGSDYKAVFVGDASMSPYEVAMAGGSVEHWNPEPGFVWLQRFTAKWPKTVWLNPVKREHWDWTQSIQMIREATGDRMFEMTLKGIEEATRELAR